LTVNFLLCKMSSCFDAICMHATQTISWQASRTQLQDLEAWYAEVTNFPNMVDKDEHMSKHILKNLTNCPNVGHRAVQLCQNQSNNVHESKTLYSSNAECDKQATYRTIGNKCLPYFSAAAVTVCFGFVVLLADLLALVGTCCAALGLSLILSCRQGPKQPCLKNNVLPMGMLANSISKPLGIDTA